MARRFDISRLQPAIVQPDGRIRADAHLTRCGVFTYTQPDGSVRRELRLREDVMSPKSLATFAGAPVTDDHPPEMLDPDNTRKFAVGAVGDTVVPDGDHVRARINVYDADTIAKMKAGKLDVSCGYNCDLDETPGNHPEYGAYDAIQRNIVGNHVAIVDRGRAGSARARMDGATVLREDEWSDAAREAAIEARRQNASSSQAATNKAAQASAQAKQSGKVQDHLKAVKAHLAAFEAARTAGDKDSMATHQAAMSAHTHAADKIATSHAETATQNAKAPPASSPFSGKTAGQQTKAQTGHTPAQIWANLRATAAAKKSLAGHADSYESIAAIENLLAKFETLWHASCMSLESARADESSPDPNDEASRNARGENDAKASAAAEPPATATNDAKGAVQSDPDDDPEDQGEEGDDEDGTPDPYDSDEDGDRDDGTMPIDGDELTDDQEKKIAAHTFAVPARKGLPIHDPVHTQKAMDSFGNYDFKSPEEKHAAFNRTYKRAIQFGIPKDKRHAFQDAHGGKLDRADSENDMKELKKLREDLAAATKRADAADKKLAAAEGQVESLKKDLDAAKAGQDGARKDAADKFDTAVTAKVELLAAARQTGATVEAKMSDREIRVATIKHVDRIDVADDRHDAYVEALFDGAIARARKDVAETKEGAQALASARQAIEGVRKDAVDQVKNDAETIDEAVVAARMMNRTASAWTQPARKETK